MYLQRHPAGRVYRLVLQDGRPARLARQREAVFRHFAILERSRMAARRMHHRWLFFTFNIGGGVA
jgi:hypothetical protein